MHPAHQTAFLLEVTEDVSCGHAVILLLCFAGDCVSLLQSILSDLQEEAAPVFLCQQERKGQHEQTAITYIMFTHDTCFKVKGT